MFYQAGAFDVYLQVAQGGYAMRAAAHLITTFFFIIAMALFYLKFLYQSGGLFRFKSYRDLFMFFFVSPGIFLKFAPIWAEYLKFDFHPNDRDCSQVVMKWSTELKKEASEGRTLISSD